MDEFVGASLLLEEVEGSKTSPGLVSPTCTVVASGEERYRRYVERDKYCDRLCQVSSSHSCVTHTLRVARPLRPLLTNINKIYIVRCEAALFHLYPERIGYRATH